ncbi:MAG: sugar transferase [Candidatus Aminicenantes bacterium]|nr:sugar transferase [Candidatus Aminicenantes bacterium]
MAGAALAVLSPLLLLIAALVRLTSPGPAIFQQSRVGRHGRSFTLFKFRTMRMEADAEDGRFDPGSRGRVTPLGQILRRTKMDELPQFWNVLKGDMAVVGPRPEVRRWTAVHPERWHVVHRVRPGMTDPASILFRNEEEILAAAADPERTYLLEILPRKLALSEEYVYNRSFMGDLKIILRTAAAVLRGRR